MKKYVIMSYDIHPLGGCQNYIYGKSQYLEKSGWTVYVLYAGLKHSQKFEFPLQKYGDGVVQGLDWIPGQLPSYLQKKVIEEMLAKIDYSEGDDITIETHYDKMHMWGELLAERTNSKNMCFNCNELFRGKDKYFEPYLDFYKFKFERKELYGIMPISIQRLFEDYLVIPEQKRFRAATPDTVQDVPFDNELPQADWNICYIGRILKSYVENVVRDMAKFAQRHTDKKINYIFVGDAASRDEFIKTTFAECPNVNIVYMGNMVPVPAKLMKMMDASIAGAGCTWCSFTQGVPTIAPDPKTCQSNGVFGFESATNMFGNPAKQCSFDTSLERVLVDNVHLKMKPLEFPHSPTSDETYDDHMQMIADSAKDKTYYPSGKILENTMYKNKSILKKLKLIIDYIHRNI